MWMTTEHSLNDYRTECRGGESEEEKSVDHRADDNEKHANHRRADREDFSQQRFQF